MAKKQTIKIEIAHLGDEGTHIFCKGKINGKKARILIDTGASKSVLSEEFAQKLKNIKHLDLSEEENKASGIGAEKVDTQFSRIKSLRFKKLKIKKLIVGTIDVSHVKALYASLNIEPFDFILGGEVLEMHNGIIDYKAKTLTLG